MNALERFNSGGDEIKSALEAGCSPYGAEGRAAEEPHSDTTIFQTLRAPAACM